VLNPLVVSGTYLSNGNHRITTGAAQGGVRSTMAFPTTAKIYFEVINASATSDPSTIQCGIGIANRSANLAGGLNGVTGIWGILWAASRRYLSANGSSSAVIIGELAINSTMQVAVDLANGYAWVGVNNTWYDASNGTTGNPSTGANATFTGLSGDLFGFADVYSMAADANFGQRPFTYTAPTGFVALNTYNLPTSTIVKGNTVMDATIYTGTGATLSVTNAGAFKPDLVWIKSRAQARSHRLQDSVRGVGNRLASDLTNAETVDASSLTSFDTGGFSLGTNINYNTSAETYVGWQWLKSASAGFDIVTFTGNGGGQTFTHNLGVPPGLMICKSLNNAQDWYVYHSSIGGTGALSLNTTAATATSVSYWSNVTPGSSTFSVGGNFSSGYTYVNYLFAPIAGFSAFGSYTGNGSADGTFVYTGFRPKFVMIKRTNTTGSWIIWDSVRGAYNLNNADLYPDLSIAEYASPTDAIDILSNGFKLRGTGVGSNGSGDTMIYAAWAENPFKNALAR
jgi:hypothetical protein